MSIRYAVLALLEEQSGHGYAMRAAFEERLGDVWELNYGQVYQVLTALEQEGLIAGADERIGKRPVRKVYSITAKGRSTLRKWLLQPPVLRRSFRDNFYLRLQFAGADQEGLRTMIEQEIGRCAEYLAGLTEAIKLRREAGTDHTVSGLLTRAAILHAEADLAALKLCRVAFQELRTQPPPARTKKPACAKEASSDARVHAAHRMNLAPD